MAFEQRVDDPAPFQELFGVEVRFGADRDEIAFPVDILDRPNPSHDPLLEVHLREAVETHVRNMLRKLGFAHRSQIAVWWVERAAQVGHPL